MIAVTQWLSATEHSSQCQSNIPDGNVVAVDSAADHSSQCQSDTSYDDIAAVDSATEHSSQCQSDTPYGDVAAVDDSNFGPSTEVGSLEIRLPDVNKSSLARSKLANIFGNYEIPQECQNRILHFMRTTDPLTLASLPKDCRTLRPATLSHTHVSMEPGEFIYFGISNILNVSIIPLYNSEETILQLSIGIDSLPISNLQ